MSGAVSTRDCPLCGSPEIVPCPPPSTWTVEQFFGRYRDSFGVSACRRCSFEFANPRPADALLAEVYGGSEYTCHDPGASHTSDARALLVLEWLERHVPGRRVLDYGCGTGNFMRVAAARGWDAEGYDPGAAAVAHCRSRGLAATSRGADLARGAFDAVVLNHVFEHVTDPHGTLNELRTLLAPAGRVFIECPNVRSLRARLSHRWLTRFARFDERYRAFPLHVSYFSPRTLHALLAANGFQVERTETWGYGIEELLREPPAHAPAGHESPRVLATAPRARAARQRGQTSAQGPKALAKRVLKRLILDAGLGENVAILAAARGG
jgi:SAM-dependent methyltransferase